MRSMRMPTSVAARALSAVACIILPARVRRKKAVKTAMMTIVPAITASCWGMTMTLPIMIGSGEVMGGNER